jgi:hypothetical protein
MIRLVRKEDEEWLCVVCLVEKRERFIYIKKKGECGREMR